MTASELLISLKRYSGNFAGHDLDESLGYLNAAIGELARDIEKASSSYFVESRDYELTGGTADQEFDLPEDFARPYRVVRLRDNGEPTALTQVDFKVRLEYGDWRQLREWYRSEEHCWYFRGGKIGFPWVSSAYTVRFHYQRAAKRLESETDTPDIPPQFHDLIARLAAAHAREDAGQAVSRLALQSILEGRRDLRLEVGRRSAMVPGPEE